MTIFSYSMNSCVSRSGNKLYFSRWNRKGYAIFASLGREVRIGNLALYICEMSLQKSSRKGVIVNLSQMFERVTALFEAYEMNVVQAQSVFMPAKRDVNPDVRYLNNSCKRKGVSVCL